MFRLLEILVNIFVAVVFHCHPFGGFCGDLVPVAAHVDDEDLGHQEMSETDEES